MFTSCIVLVAFGQPPTTHPFAGLDKQVKDQGGWGIDNQRLAELFNLERRRLGDHFEPALMKYLGQDVKKHYWISAFLEAPTYLQGATPLPHLSLLIKQQALAFLDRKQDDESLSNIVRLSVTAAVLSEQLGLHELAVSHKARTEQLLQKQPELAASVPAMVDEERKLYDSLLPHKIETGAPKDQPTWRATEAALEHSSTGKSSNPPPRKINVSAGVLQEQAIKKVQPAYPLEARTARVSGLVKVQVLVSEEGRVIEATALQGPEPLLGAALDAARQWRFKPATLSGQAVQMLGVLSFHFTLK
jgi:TonB family protein